MLVELAVKWKMCLLKKGIYQNCKRFFLIFWIKDGGGVGVLGGLIYVMMQAIVIQWMYKLWEKKNYSQLKYSLLGYCYSSCAGACFEFIKLHCNKRKKPAF